MVKYIEFNLVAHNGVTQVYAVRNIKSQLIIGWIKWNGAWRQYCFYPESETLYSEGCLTDICNLIIQLMNERRNK